MAALTQDRITRNKWVGRLLDPVPVEAALTTYLGGMVAANAAGNGAPAADTASFHVLGIAQSQANNAAGIAGAISVSVLTGTFILDNDATHPVTQASLGMRCYVKDDHTVQVVGGSAHSVVAGIVDWVGVDSRGNNVVHVYIAPEVAVS